MPQLPEVRSASVEDLADVAALATDGRLDLAVEPDIALIHLSVFLAGGGQIFVVDQVGQGHDSPTAEPPEQDDGDTHRKIVGFLLVRVLEPHLFSATRAAIIDAMFVDPPARRHGIGHALVLAVANLAESVDSAYVYAVPPTGDRSMQRFLARLGFAPMAGHRVVTTAMLLRRLADEVPTLQVRGRGAKTTRDEVIARRRRARTGLPTGTLDLRAVRGIGAR